MSENTAPKLRVVFMGTPEFAVPSLEACAVNFDVVGVVTRPDAVRGRGKTLEPSAVKTKALELGLPVFETNKMTPEAMDQLRSWAPEIIAVAAFGCILPDEVLELPKYGCVNVHASLLPRWRGAAPVQRAVLAGDKYIGVSIMKIVHELDAGDFCARYTIEVGNKNSEQLLRELAVFGAALLPSAMDAIAKGTIKWISQDSCEEEVTFAPKIDKREMRLDPASDAMDNWHRIQASTDAQPARCVIAGKGVRVLSGGVLDAELKVGEVYVEDNRLFLGCSNHVLELVDIKPDGKREMKASEWVAGLRGDDLTWESA